MSIGEKSGYLTVLSEPRRVLGRMVVDCQCDCGRIKAVNPWYLARGLVKSCGCLKKEWGIKMRNANAL